MTSQKPYFIRALYEWCSDNGFTPHLLTFVDANTMVPQQFVRDNQIVLNIAFDATKDLHIDNEWITFKATFSGNIQDIAIPTANVLALFAKENGQGMQFELENPAPKTDSDKPAPQNSGLKLVK